MTNEPNLRRPEEEEDRMAVDICNALVQQSNADDYRTVAVDVDGVLALYMGWKDSAGRIGPPDPHAQRLLYELKRKNRVVIWSSRSSALIYAWLVEHSLMQFVDEINTNSKLLGDNPGKPIASAYIDDRAIRFDGDVNKLLSDVEHLVEWWR